MRGSPIPLKIFESIFCQNMISELRFKCAYVIFLYCAQAMTQVSTVISKAIAEGFTSGQEEMTGSDFIALVSDFQAEISFNIKSVRIIILAMSIVSAKVRTPCPHAIFHLLSRSLSHLKI